jgi:hypothetical protein
MVYKKAIEIRRTKVYSELKVAQLRREIEVSQRLIHKNEVKPTKERKI